MATQERFLTGAAQIDSRAEVSYQPLTLACKIDHQAPLPATEALDILAQLLTGLSHLHAHGLIHRDVKPSNVLFVDGQVKLADVGLVTTTDRDITQIGTPEWMTPEGTVDQTSDLYAAGLILYKMLTGYPRSKFPELPALTPKTRPDRRALRAAIRIANKAANFDRRQRYKSVTEFTDDLRRPVRFRLRFNRGTAILGLGLVMALAVALIAYGFFATGPRLVAVYPKARISKDVVAARILVLDYEDSVSREVSFNSNLSGAAKVDFDGDDRPTAIVGFADEGELMSQLHEYDPSVFRRWWGADDPLWAQQRGHLPPAAWNHQPFGKPCKVVPIRAVDLDHRPGEELILAEVYPESPTRLVVYGKGWRVLSEFWHYGHMTSVEAVDLDGDSWKELICSGLANDRPEPTPFEAKTEPWHLAVMVLDPLRRSEPAGHWSRNRWMNEESLHPPKAYGYVKLPIEGEMQNAPWSSESVAPYPGEVASIRVHFKNNLLLELNADLTAFKVRANDASLPHPDPIPLVEEVWEHLWPAE